MPMLREEIRQIVQASVKEALMQLGLKVEDPHALQKDMIHLRQHRIGQEEMQKWVKRTAVVMLVTGFLYFMWDAFTQTILFKR